MFQHQKVRWRGMKQKLVFWLLEFCKRQDDQAAWLWAYRWVEKVRNSVPASAIVAGAIKAEKIAVDKSAPEPLKGEDGPEAVTPAAEKPDYVKTKSEAEKIEEELHKVADEYSKFVTGSKSHKAYRDGFVNGYLSGILRYGGFVAYEGAYLSIYENGVEEGKAYKQMKQKAAVNADLKKDFIPKDTGKFNYFVISDYATEHKLDYNELCQMVHRATFKPW